MLGILYFIATSTYRPVKISPPQMAPGSRPATLPGHARSDSIEPQLPPMSITDRMDMKRTVIAAVASPTVIRRKIDPRAVFTRGSLLWNARRECLCERLADRRQLDPVEDVLEKAADDQPLGVLARETAGHGVEELVAVD